MANGAGRTGGAERAVAPVERAPPAPPADAHPHHAAHRILARVPEETRARLGEILAARGLDLPADLAAAATAQARAPHADLDREPPPPDLLTEALLPVCLSRRAAPWRRLPGGGLVLAAPEPAVQAARLPALRRAFGLLPGAPLLIAPCDADAWDRAMLARHPRARAARASARPHVALSAVGLARPLPRALVAATGIGILAALALVPDVALPVLFGLALALNLVAIVWRLACLRASRPGPAALPEEGLRPADLHPPVGAAEEAPLPRVSLIVALYREPHMVPQLLAGLAELDWPRDRLEVLLALEEEDAETQEAVAAAHPPPWVRVVLTPPGGPRTKPRALNHALDFARGAIVGVYDAEDRPAPDQLHHVAEAFARGSGRLACVQARLAFRNEGDGWIARCFAVEYVTWFHLVLPGLCRLGAPIPLGGTSLFVRRRALEAVGAWDAHNVTEDADLGVRLARAGYVTGIVDSETAEEATASPVAWIRQRSRWQKGYVQTWLVHMRAPLRLWRELGPRGFLGFQAHFITAAAAVLSQPLFWGVFGWWILVGPPWSGAPFDSPLGAVLLAGLWAGQAVALATARAALRRAGRQELAWVALSLPLYFPLSAVAALKSLVEVALAPLYWDKTDHGVRARDRRRLLAYGGRAQGTRPRRPMLRLDAWLGSAVWRGGGPMRGTGGGGVLSLAPFRVPPPGAEAAGVLDLAPFRLDGRAPGRGARVLAFLLRGRPATARAGGAAGPDEGLRPLGNLVLPGTGRAPGAVGLARLRGGAGATEGG